VSHKNALSFQDVVRGLDEAMFNDLMANIAWFFKLHDNNKDGYLTKDEVLKVSESLLVSTSLNSHSKVTFIKTCFSCSSFSEMSRVISI